MGTKEIDDFCDRLNQLIQSGRTSPVIIKNFVKDYTILIHDKTKKELLNLMAEAILKDQTIFEAVVTINNKQYGLSNEETE